MLPLHTGLERLALGRRHHLDSASLPAWMRSGDDGQLSETTDFGLDPGDLRMLTFVPDGLAEDAPLVVVLHGCTQSASAYDEGSGWSALAEQHGFALLYPEQRRCNNANLCFNWFEPADTQRGRGEVASIRAMIGQMLRAHRLDARRVYVTGLSAGASMAGAMLATYPEVFAGGGLIAGLPYGCARNVHEAFELMLHDHAHPARLLGDRVRAASRHDGPWPTVSIWHGTADTTVRPSNAREVVHQWLDAHGIAAPATLVGTVDDFPYEGWVDQGGRIAVEYYEVTGMAHGAPLAVNSHDPDQRQGRPGPFMLNAGIASSFRLAQRWGLVGRQPGTELATGAPARSETQSSRPGRQSGRRIDPADVIEGALQAAGLLRRRV